jgi:hypothetical protein
MNSVKLSWAASHVKWLKTNETDVPSKDHLCPRPQGTEELKFPEDKDRDGSRNIGFISF